LPCETQFSGIGPRSACAALTYSATDGVARACGRRYSTRERLVLPESCKDIGCSGCFARPVASACRAGRPIVRVCADPGANSDRRERVGL
jgi:hypothetical protein